MKHLIATTLLLASPAATFAAPTADHLSIELPYTEGTLYISVTDSAENVILREAVEVESDNITIPVDIDGLTGEALTVAAFLDLNGNGSLDFDSYGRPEEPCLRTEIVPQKGQGSYPLRLIQY